MRLGLLLLCVLVPALPRCESQTLSLSVEPGELSLGAECRLVCKASLYDGRKVHWQRNDVQLVEPTTVSESSPSVSLQIEALKQSDQGTYTCVLTLNQAKVEQATLELEIPPPQISISVTNGTQELALSLGGTVTLTCLVSFPEDLIGSITTIQWEHGGPAVNNQTSTNLTSGTSELTISLSLLTDAGVYVCSANVSSPYLDIASVYKTASTGITIQGPNSEAFVTPNKAVPFVAGMYLNLHCTITVFHPKGFDISGWWLRNGTVVTESTDGRITKTDISLIGSDSTTTSFLMFMYFKPLSKKLDSGFYSCGVEVGLTTNAYVLPSVSLSSPYPLTVQAPLFNIQLNPHSHTIPKSFDFPVTCMVTASKSLGVDKNFSWTSGPADIITTYSPFSSSPNIEGSSTATIHSNAPGTYTVTCGVMVSVLGDEPVTAENSATIHVLDETVQLEITTSGSLVPGDRYELTCNATNLLPEFLGPPKVYWTQNGTNLTSDANQGVELEEAVEESSSVLRTLVLNPVSQGHKGQYRCVAVQLEETTSVEESIEVLAPGTSVTMTSNLGQTPLLGSSGMLSCTASLPPSLGANVTDIQWTRDGVPLSSDELNSDLAVGSSNLVFTAISTSDAGEYMCIVEINSLFVDPYSQNDSMTIKIRLPEVSGFVITADQPAPFMAGVQLKLAYIFSVSSHVKTDDSISISAQWLKNGTQLSSLEDNRITVMEMFLSSFYTYQGWLTISPLSLKMDSVSVMCTVSLKSSLSNVIPSTSAKNFPLLITAPNPSVSLFPTLIRIPDTHPYNKANFTCIASVSRSLEVNKLINWAYNFEILSTTTTPTTNPSGLNSSSTLSTSVSVAGIFTATCSVMISVPGDSPVSVSRMSTVMVTGPSPPVAPGNLLAINITYKSAMIRWTVSEISYTPEAYVVKYGLHEDQLTNMSEVISGGMDFLTVNQTMGVHVTNLEALTRYFFVVEATNTNGMTLSATESFETSHLSPPSMPTNFQMKSVNSTTFLFEWEPPSDGPEFNEDIVSYLLDCKPSPPPSSQLEFPIQFLVASLDGDDKGVFANSLSGFVPGTLYTCTLLAENSGGMGNKTSTSQSTNEEAPGSPPSNITVSILDSASILISWQPPQIPNGQISAYFLHVNYMNGSSEERWTIDAAQEEWMVTGLSPYQRVGLRMSASTQAGEGPLCDYVYARSGEKAPAALEEITFSYPSSSVLMIEFSYPPDSIARGNITHFILSLELYPEGLLESKKISKQPNATVYMSSFTDLRGLVPYIVSLVAVNSAGVGETSSTIVFTEEGIPPPPSNVRGLRLNGTHMNISWSLIPLTESQGFILSYTIYYQQLIFVNKRQSGSTAIERDQSYGIVGGLDPNSQYQVFVKASTVAGSSENSDTVIVLPVESGIFLSNWLIVVVAAAGVGVILLLLILCMVVAITITMCKRKKEKRQLDSNIRTTDNNNYEPKFGIELADCNAYGTREVPLPPFVDDCGQPHIYDSIDSIRQKHAEACRVISREVGTVDDSASPSVRNEYDRPREVIPLSPQRIRQLCSAPSFLKGFTPLNNSIPEEMEGGGGDVDRAYDVIKDGQSVCVQYDIPQNKSFRQSSDQQFGVVNPCYATALEERETKIYNVPKNSQ